MASRRSRRSKARQSQGRKGARGVVSKCLIGVGLLLVLALLAGLVFGYNAVRSYLRSDDFRTMLGKRAGMMLEGRGDFTPFRWDGWGVSTEEFSFVGAEGVREFHARDLDGEIDVGAVWNQVYRLENIRLREFEFRGDFREGVTGTGEIDVWEPEPDRFWSDFLPDRVEVTGVDVASLRGEALTDEGDWSWENMPLRIRPGSGEGVYELNLSGGEISTPLPVLEELRLRSAEGRVSGNRFYLLDSDFDVLKDARILARGDVDFAKKEWQLEGELTGAGIEEVVAEDWKQRLMGPLEASFKVRGEPGKEIFSNGDLRLKDGVLTALPVLDRIAAYTGSMRFRRLALSEASLEFSKQGDVLNLRNIILASEGLVRMEGEMRIEGEVIRKGDFRIGVTPGTLGHLPGAETKVFQRGDLGLLWTPLTISGTLDAPQEDLSERLIAAAGERMFEMIPETGQYALKYSGKAIGDSTRRILSGEGIILGAGKSLLEQATRAVGGITGAQVDEPDEAAESDDAELEVPESGRGAAEKGVDTLFDLFGRPIKK